MEFSFAWFSVLFVTAGLGVFLLCVLLAFIKRSVIAAIAVLILWGAGMGTARELNARAFGHGPQAVSSNFLGIPAVHSGGRR
jgi:hypothetical protein